MLQVAIKYEQGELSAAKQLLDRLGEDEGHVMLNQVRFGANFCEFEQRIEQRV